MIRLSSPKVDKEARNPIPGDGETVEPTPIADVFGRYLNLMVAWGKVGWGGSALVEANRGNRISDAMR
jgi:hypothetical protein